MLKYRFVNIHKFKENGWTYNSSYVIIGKNLKETEVIT